MARHSLEGAEDKVKTVIKIPLHLTGLESLEGSEGHSGSQLFSQSPAWPSEDEQVAGVLLAHLSWIQVPGDR